MNLVVAGLLMVVCAGAMARLMWLMEGRPRLGRPRWMRRSRT